MKLIIAWAVGIVFFCVQSASARTITVGPGHDFAKIQQAIDAATTGDTIIVYPGVYVENIVIAKDIILRSTSPTDSAVVAATIIDGNSSGSVVRFSEFISKECVLSGFTIQNGDAMAYPGGASGGGISTLAPAETGRCEARIENNVITGNRAAGGGGIAVCHGTIANNIIKDNRAEVWNGGGIESCNGTIERNIIYGNSTCEGLSGGAGIEFCNGTIQDNLIAKNIGRAAVARCDGIIRNNIIALNVQHPQDQMAAALYECNATIENNAILFNFGEGVELGGGLYVCRGVVRNCIIWGNKPSQLEDSTTPMYSCIEGWAGGGVGNINTDPLIPIGEPGDSPFNYLMSPSSPCIDAGDPSPQFNDGGRPPAQGTERNDMGAFGGPYNTGWFLNKFIVVRAPNGGEAFSASTLQEIRWESSANVQKVNIFFTYRTSSVQTETLATGLANTGAMRWPLPSFAADECSIRVVDTDDPATSDTSDAAFGIVAERTTFNVLSPNGGEVYFWGDTIPIRWTSTNASHWVGIHFTTNFSYSQSQWQLAAYNIPNTGEFLWTPPRVNSNKCRVSVFDMTVAFAYDMSDNDFWIYSSQSLTLPNLKFGTADFHPPAPTQMRPGDPLAISALVENTGKTASGPCWFEVWGSRTGGITLDYFLCQSERLGAVSADGTFSLNLAKPLSSLPDGPYSVVYVLDRPNEVAEMQEGDNRTVVAGKRLLTIRPPTRANLMIDGFAIGPNPLVSGRTVTFGGWVRNTGTEDSGPFWIEFWGSTNRIFPQLDFYLCNSVKIFNLPAGQSIFLGYYERRLYDCPSGIFMAGVYLDRLDEVNEINEVDNYAFVDGIVFAGYIPPAPPAGTAHLEGTVVRSLAEPDLVVVSSDFLPAAPTTIAPGGPIQISTRVENRGTADSGPFWLEFWGSKLGGLSLNDFIGDSVYVPNIAAGQAFAVSRNVVLYSMPDGPYTFTVVADRLGAVADANPRNNRLAVAGKRILTIRPQTQANLRTENFAVTTTTLPRSQPIPMTGQVRNTGTQDSGPFWIEFWGSYDQMYPELNFYLCDSIYVPNLAAGAALDLAANPRTLYATAPTGPCMILCFPDRPDFVNETDESDNVGAIAGGLIIPFHGTITINVTPASGSWQLTGPAGFTPVSGTGDRLGGAAITNAPPVGNYTLTCNNNVAGYNPPAPETKALAEAGTIAFTPTYTPESVPNEITINLPGNVPLVLVRVPSGSFQMGSPDTERFHYSDEGPVHTVSIAYNFYMGKYELTQKQWLALMGSWPGTAPSTTYGLGDNYPAYRVSWNDVQNFITALNTHVTSTSQGPATFGLPSEAEWEYACRAGTQTRFFFGDSLSVADGSADGPAGTLPGDRSDYMWFAFNCSGDSNGAYGSKPVGTKLPNQFGLYDMSGNVWEWCQDWYHDSYTGAPSDGSAWESPSGSDRVCRGGYWGGSIYSTMSCRSAYRHDSLTPDIRYHSRGFRLSRTE